MGHQALRETPPLRISDIRMPQDGKLIFNNFLLNTTLEAISKGPQLDDKDHQVALE